MVPLQNQQYNMLVYLQAVYGVAGTTRHSRHARCQSTLYPYTSEARKQSDPLTVNEFTFHKCRDKQTAKSLTKHLHA